MTAEPLPVTWDDVLAAEARIKGSVERTPSAHSRTLSEILGCQVVVKFENLQFTAAYKERGALNKLLQLTDAERDAGVIAMSAGNHGQAVAYHAHRLGIDATKQVVAYDQTSGVYASRLWWMLRWLGHDSVAVLDGGFAKWTREGRPVSTDVPQTSPTKFVAARVLPTVNATGIAASLPRHGLLLLDARAAERYRGEAESIDPVAGHIPGALNRPYTRNIHDDGTFRSPRELRGEFEAMLHGRPPDDLVHYCGSGITACHNLLAMTIAGYPLTRLYPGSWSEWITDRRRPIAKGQI